jgi:hypothetical protein
MANPQRTTTVTEQTVKATVYKPPYSNAFTILGDNILDHMEIAQAAHWAIRRYFNNHPESHPLWKALYEYITT